MGYQTVRALVPIRHSGVLRIPGQTSGDNAQDFVAEDSQVARLVALGFVTSLGVAADPTPNPQGSAVKRVELSVDRALSSSDMGANLVIRSSRTVSIGAGLSDMPPPHFLNPTEAALNITISGTDGVKINGETNGSVTRSVPARGSLSMRSDATDSFNVPAPATGGGVSVQREGAQISATPTGLNFVGLQALSNASGIVDVMPRAFPRPANNRYVVGGDSRMYNSANGPTDNPFIPHGVGQWSIPYFIDAYSEFRGEFVGKHAQNTATIQNIFDNLNTSTGIFAPSGTGLGNIISATDAATLVLLIGINVGANTLASKVTVYRQIIDAWLASRADRCVIVCDELPSNSSAAPTQANHSLFHRWLQSVSSGYPSSRVVVAPTWGAVSSDDTSNMASLAGAYLPSDPLHPRQRGAQAIGKAVGMVFRNIMVANGFLPRTALPLFSSDPGFASTLMMAGGTTTATGITVQTPAGLTCTPSKLVDDQGFDVQLVRIQGTPTATTAYSYAGIYAASITNPAWLADGNTSRLCADMRLVDKTNMAGFGGFVVNSMYQASGFPNYVVSQGYTTAGLYTPSVDDVGIDDDHVRGPMTTPRITIPAGWSAVAGRAIYQPGFYVACLPGKAIDVTMAVRRAGFIVNG